MVFYIRNIISILLGSTTKKRYSCNGGEGGATDVEGLGSLGIRSRVGSTLFGPVLVEVYNRTLMGFRGLGVQGFKPQTNGSQGVGGCKRISWTLRFCGSRREGGNGNMKILYNLFSKRIYIRP